MPCTWDVRILNASYASDDQGTPYIELFGKTRDRTSITLVVYDFKPYFFIVDPTPAAEEGLKGDIPSPLDVPTGCVFRTRCPYAKDECAAKMPELTDRGGGHLCACILK